MGQRTNALRTPCLALVCLAACGAPQDRLASQSPGTLDDPFEGLPPLAQEGARRHPREQAGPTPPHRFDLQLPPLALELDGNSIAKELRVVCHPPLDGDPSGAIAYVFNQPMVDPAGDSSAAPGSIKVTPTTEGDVGWLGDRTLVFTPRDRFRFATTYRAVLSPGLVSSSGAKLRAPVQTGFTTRTPTLLEARPSPGEIVDPWPVFSLRFNQPVDPTAVLSRLRLHGPRPPSLRLDPRLGSEPHLVRVEPTSPLKVSTHYRLQLMPGLSSAEGSLSSEQAQEIPFSVAGPQRLAEIRCPHHPCLPEDTVQVVVLPARPTDQTCRHLDVTPAPQNLRCEAQGEVLLLSARFAPGATYLLRLADSPPEEPPLTLAIGHHRRITSSLPERPLMLLRPGLPIATSGPREARIARVRPEMVVPVLQAIAAPDALAPFLLAETPSTIGAMPPRAALELPAAQGTAGTIWLVSLEGAKAITTPSGRRAALIQVTSLGLTLRYGWDSGVALVTGPDGEGASKAAIVVRDRQGTVIWRGQSSSSGLARFPGRKALAGSPPYTLWAEHGSDRAFVVLDGGGEDGISAPGYLPHQPAPPMEKLVGTVLTDRRRYSPGAQVRVFGVLRGQTRLPLGNIGHIPSRHTEIAFRVTGPSAEEVSSGRSQLNSSGLFSAAFALPAEAPPGRYSVWISIPDASRDLADWVLGSFVVSRPDSGLHLTLSQTGAHPLLGQTATVTLGLVGLGRHPVAGASVRWQLYRSRGAAKPDGFSEFSFSQSENPGAPHLTEPPTNSREAIWVADGQGLTDALGLLKISPRLSAPELLGRASFLLEVDVETLDGRTLETSRRLNALGARAQLGLRVERNLVTAPMPVEATVVSLDSLGMPVQGSHATVEASLDGSPGPSCTTRLGTGTDSCYISLPSPGRWTVCVRHPGALPACTQLLQAAKDPAEAAPPVRLEALLAEDVLDGQRPTEILLRTPAARGSALLTLEQDGLVWADAIPLRGHEARVVLPAGISTTSQAWLSASVVSPIHAGRALLHTRRRVRGARATEELAVRAVVTKKASTASWLLDIAVRDPHGDPTRAAIFVIAHPTSAAFPPLGEGLARPPGPGMALRSTELLARDALGGSGTASDPAPSRAEWLPGPWPADGDRASTTDPDDLVRFIGPLVTDPLGRLSLSLDLPRLHRPHKLTILAADTTFPYRFGRHLQELQSEQALELVAQPPQLMRQGDRAVFPVTLHNQTGRGGRAELIVRSSGAPVSPRYEAFYLSPGISRDVKMLLGASHPGLTRIQLGARMGSHRSSIERRVVVLDEHRTGGPRDRAGALRGTARLPLISPSNQRSPGRLTLTLASRPYLASREILTRLALAERPTLAGTALGLMALGLLREPSFRDALSPWLDEASFQYLGAGAFARLHALRLPGGGFRRHPGGPPAELKYVGLALIAMEEALASGLRIPRPISTEALERLKTLASSTHVPAQTRTESLVVLRATKQFLRPTILSNLLHAKEGLSPETRARSLWLFNGADRPRDGASPHGRTTIGPMNAESRAFTLLALAEARTDASSRQPVATQVFESLTGQEDPWIMAWSLLALRAEARLPGSGDRPSSISVWVDSRLLGRSDQARGDASILHLSSPLSAGRNHEAILDTPKGTWTFYHARLHAQPDRLHTHPDVSLSASMELPRSQSQGGQPSSVSGSGVRQVAKELATASLAVGETAVGRITLVTTASLGESRLKVPIPAGARLVDPGWPVHSSEQPKPPWRRFPALPVLGLTQQGDSLFLQLDAIPPGIHEYRWVIQATMDGHYRCDSATLRRASNDSLLALAAPCETLRIGQPP
ncbi:MAG: MG2 domain-containing protein [Polyangia bacterium]|jgi:hypothetical protein|nr:MG2 domain-containing protein [Polyangia bacterium]